tara:strand:+ start:1306 stop:1944 length:639 start_codon:yes stop_codon:yes gene_type:complete
MKQLTYLLFILCTCIITHAQGRVGINTATPQATLDVNGGLRVTVTPIASEEEKASIIGTTTNNKINKVNIGSNLTVDSSGELISSPVVRSLGSFDLGNAPQDSPQTYNNLKLNINLTEENEFVNYINIYNYINNVTINGIADGTEGRRLTLYANSSFNMRIENESTLANPAHRIETLSGSLTISGQGFIEIIYDADAGLDGLGRWLVIKFNP